MPTFDLHRVRLVAIAMLVTFATFGSSLASPPEILVSRQLAEAFDLEEGDSVELAATAEGEGSRTYRIVGIYEPMADPIQFSSRRHEARLHLDDLLELTHEPGTGDTLDAINVKLRDPSRLFEFQRELSQRSPGLYARPTVVADEGSPFVALEQFHWAIAVVTVLGSTAFLVALMIMRAEERRETVGILRLIGLTRRRILLEVLIEGLFIALVGAVFGVVFASLLQGLVNVVFQDHYDTALVFMRITPSIAWRCLLIAVPLGVLAGWLASWTLLRREIVALLRR
jgi:putative ABC transport system permease protein